AIKARLKDSAGHRGDEIKKVLEEAETNEIVGRLRVSALLEALPGVGKVKAQQIMEEIGISPSRKIRGLGSHQAEKLVAHFAERAMPPPGPAPSRRRPRSPFWPVPPPWARAPSPQRSVTAIPRSGCPSPRPPGPRGPVRSTACTTAS